MQTFNHKHECMPREYAIRIVICPSVCSLFLCLLKLISFLYIGRRHPSMHA